MTSSTSTPTSASLSWGPSQRNADEAAQAVAEMSTEQKIGQVLVPFYSGEDPAPEVQAIGELGLAGSIVMGDNVPVGANGLPDVAAVKGVTGALADAAVSARTEINPDWDWPAIISVDQEGGIVARLRDPVTEWPAPMSYGAAGDTELTQKAYSTLGSELKAMGFTMDHAASVDTTIGPEDPTIGSRSFGSDPEMVSEQGIAAWKGLWESGIIPDAKHFPGHGSVTTDSHLGLPVQDASVEQLQARDWKPFRAAIDSGIPVVMMGHIAVPALEDGVASSVSAPSYQALRDLGFEGVVITDALNMAAVDQAFPDGQAAVKALASGADLLLMPTDVYQAQAALMAALGDGTVRMSRLDEAATRVITLMKWYQDTNAPTPDLSTVGSPDNQAVAAEVSEKALTVVEGPCQAEPVSSVRVVGGSPADQERVSRALADAGIATGAGPVVALSADGSTPPADIAVTVDAPWALATWQADTKIALFGRDPGAYTALAKYLAGSLAASGKLPVAVEPYALGASCR
ncbi:glycoside hydrolase family 3 protein [Haematomicrobium sanguinis]|uniref:glycoside hydrolase family 3 protein n=1 Tax=Haematomicrobium sanguinis TaxID=479106 RepID=UPI000AE0E993|nr:glycoside hydrolase family 3 N-terminal domain-containing protein [Haematomicrobium sanguinis]